MTSNLVDHLRTCTGLSDAQLEQQIAQRAGYAALGAHVLRQWQEGKTPMPKSAERVAVLWIVELWRAERDGCSAQHLWPVDRKYTRMLEGFTIADIVRLAKAPINRAS